MGKVIWRWEYGVYVPFCPYCDEPAYDKDRCVFCGREYEYTEGEYKPTEVLYKGYTAFQSTNNHITIYKNGETISHISCDSKMTESELLKMIEDRMHGGGKINEAI